MALNRENYFSKENEKKYMGSTQFKAWDTSHGGCEAKQIAIAKGEWEEQEKIVFLVGQYVHAWNEGRTQEFIAEHPEMIAKSGKNKGGFKREFVIADKMICTLRDDPYVQIVREGEKEQIFVGIIDGVPIKICVDILNLKLGCFNDIKTTKNIRELNWNSTFKSKLSFVETYDYKMQMAIYAEILRQNLEMDSFLDPYITVVDKQEVPDHEVIFMGTDFIEGKLTELKEKLPRIIAVKTGVAKPKYCGKCDYCRSIKKLDGSINLIDFERKIRGV